jgi:MFS superfamily sulfate permease-like transporter
VIVAAGIAQAGGFEAFLVSVFLAGLIQVVLSRLKAGVLGNFFPTSVITGMLAAIGLILILKQIPHAVGLDSSFMGSLNFFQDEDGENTFSEILRAFDVFDLECSLIALSSFLVIFCWERLLTRLRSDRLKSIPAPLLAVVIGVLLAEFGFRWFGLELEPKHRVQLPFSGGWTEFLHGLSRPDWSVLSRPGTYLLALTIAIVGSLESLLSLDAADKIDPKRKNSSKNRELLAQGVANAASGLLGGLPITAVIVRTSANVNAGAETRLSGILHGVWLLLAVVIFPGLLSLIPLSVLAVILILVGYKLTKPVLYIKYFKKGMDQFIPFIVTVLAILLTDLLKGIAIGMLVGFVFVIKRSHHKAMILVKDDENHYLLRFMKDVSFLHKHDLVQHLRSIPSGATLDLDGSRDVQFDADIIELLEDYTEGAARDGIQVLVRKSKSATTAFFRG